jgi:hypothetical protein
MAKLVIVVPWSSVSLFLLSYRRFIQPSMPSMRSLLYETCDDVLFRLWEGGVKFSLFDFWRENYAIPSAATHTTGRTPPVSE